MRLIIAAVLVGFYTTFEWGFIAFLVATKLNEMSSKLESK